MLRDAYAWHYQQYSDNCSTKKDYAIAEDLVEKKGWEFGIVVTEHPGTTEKL